MIHFTADIHFGHKNILKYSNRPFSSVEEMDQVIIDNWNSKVKEEDSVFFLGDFTFGKSPRHYLPLLNGKKIIIKGNHDKGINFPLSHLLEGGAYIVDKIFELNLYKDHIRKEFNYEPKVLDPLLQHGITLCHYPMIVWNKSHRGSIMLHGHCHGSLPAKFGRIIDVGVDTNNFYPYSMDEILTIARKIPVWTPDHHSERE